MKIVIITGSPHKNGASALLVEQFMEGAKEAGHDVFRFDAAFANVHPCLGCDKCGMGQHPCVQKDDMRKLYPQLYAADVVVFATPLYYFGMSAQIKTVIDRFYAIDGLLHMEQKRAALLLTAASDQGRILAGLVGNYGELLHYLGWKDCGTILAIGCATREDVAKGPYAALAYGLGKTLLPNA